MHSSFEHWNKVYQTKDHNQVSWHQDSSTISLDWILKYTSPNDAVIDIGSGVSILADNLLAKKYKNISLLEISTTALQITKDRLKKYSKFINFYNQNILDFSSKQQFNLWHDRAVFHFLTIEKDQQTYIKKLNKYLKKDGFFILATFSPDGPKECSDLDIIQYDKEKITNLLGDDFTLVKTKTEKHPHPNGSIQLFNYFCFKKN